MRHPKESGPCPVPLPGTERAGGSRGSLTVPWIKHVCIGRQREYQGSKRDRGIHGVLGS